jgi:uncharacterized protein
MSPQENNGLRELARRLSLSVSDDGMEAGALVIAGDALKVDANGIAAFLAANGISDGLQLEALVGLAKLISSSSAAATEVDVARGVAPANGKDGFVTYSFQTELTAGKVDDAGNIDFRERGLVNNVAADQELATVCPATEGTPGLSVSGRELPAANGVDPALPKVGHNVKVSEDGLCYVSTIQGHASLSRAGVLQVSPELVISGDMDFEIGNIDFSGNVTVGGDVKSGFIIRAGGDISVRGEVESKAQLHAGRNVVVRGAIRTGTDQPRVSAMRNIDAGSIENAFVRAEGNVSARELLLDSKVECTGEFVCERGEIRGSEVQAVGGMVVNNVGTEEGVANVLTVGLTRHVAAMIRAVEEKLSELNKANDQVFSAFRNKYEEVLRDRSAREKMTPEDREEFDVQKKAASQRQETMNDEVQKLKARLDELGEQLREKAGSTVVVTGTIHPMCTIYAREQSMVVRPGKPQEKVVFYEKDDPPSVSSEKFDPKRLAVVGESRTYVGAGGDDGGVKDPSNLADRVKDHEIKAVDLAAEIVIYAGQSVALAKSAVRISAEAVKAERYRKPCVYAAEGQAWLKVVEAVDAESRKKAADKVLKACKLALELDASYPQAHSAMGRAHYLLGEFNESLACHRQAVENINKYSGEVDAALAHYEFAETASGIAEALAEKAPEKAAEFWADAAYQCEDYLSKEPNGTQAEACREITARASEALGGEEDTEATSNA